MGTEAAWVPLVISALGATAQAVNQHQQATRQEDISNQLVRGQQRHQHEADAALNQNLDALGRSTGQQERQASLEGFLQQLRANAGASTGGGVPSTASDRAQQEAATGASTIQNYGANRAGVMSRIMGPTLQRVNEGAMANRTEDQIRGAARNASGDAWLAQLRSAQNVQNPWINALGEGAQAYGGAMAGSGWNPNDPALTTPNITARRMPEIPPYLKRGAFGS